MLPPVWVIPGSFAVGMLALVLRLFRATVWPRKAPNRVMPPSPPEDRLKLPPAWVKPTERLPSVCRAMSPVAATPAVVPIWLPAVTRVMLPALAERVPIASGPP